MVQVLCRFAFHFLSAIHSKLENMWRILVLVPEGVMICSINFAQILKEYSVSTQKKLWLQNFFVYASASLQMKAHFEKFQSAPKIKITLPQQSGILYFYLYFFLKNKTLSTWLYYWNVSTTYRNSVNTSCLIHFSYKFVLCCDWRALWRTLEYYFIIITRKNPRKYTYIHKAPNFSLCITFTPGWAA